MENMVKVGRKVMPGSIWDEIGKTKIVRILISHGNNEINSIQFVYVVDEKVILSEMHGEPHGSKFDMVTFDHPKEYLVSVRGRFSNSLISIAFGTNNCEYGPFGRADDSSTTYEKFVYNFRPKSSFGGFHGSVYSSCVYAIGVYIKPIESLGETDYIKPIESLGETDKSGTVKSEDD